MTLEQEAWRQYGVARPSPDRRPTAFDRIARAVALLLLIAAFGATVYVFVFLLGPFGLVLLLAVLGLAVVILFFRLMEVARRLRRAEERLGAVQQELAALRPQEAAAPAPPPVEP